MATSDISKIELPDGSVHNIKDEVARSNAGLSEALAIGSTAPSNTKILWIDTGNGGIAKYYNGTEWATVKAVWG